MLLWGDSSVYDSDADGIEAGGALLVCDRSVACRPHHHGLRLVPGREAHLRRPTVQTLCCAGNTGVCAARWALALGCRPVYLLGMSAEYDGGRTDFYGVNPHHGGRTPEIMRRELRRLVEGHAGRVQPIPSGEMLRAAAGRSPAVDQRQVRRAVLALISAPRDVSFAAAGGE